jgi:hypothetical protein
MSVKLNQYHYGRFLENKKFVFVGPNDGPPILITRILIYILYSLTIDEI